MTGDFSRMTFDKNKHFLRVLMQQGRVQLDSDWNEQVAILLHYLQTVVKDVVGPYAGPKNALGFAITGGDNRNFKIGAGRYYVDGLLVENEAPVWYRSADDGDDSQPDFHDAQLGELEDGNYLVYLDAWERPITYMQDDDIRETALGGSDTATRSKVIWQVKVNEFENSTCLEGAALLEKKIALSPVCLSARAKRVQIPTEPCLVDPESRYRGAENQLYRIEIHQRGRIGRGGNDKPTFKWSRDNGSIVFPIEKITVDNSSSVTTVELEHLGRDSRFSLSVGDWVELADDDYILLNEAKPLLQVSSIDRMNRKVALTGTTGVSGKSAKHPFLRRWDHNKSTEFNLQDGAIPFPDSGKWVELEDGIEIQFHAGDEGAVRSGDYWLIPARTATGDVEWPKQDNGNPEPMPPHGIMHHYAPIAIIHVNAEGAQVIHDCRCSFEPLSYTCAYSYYGQLGIGIDLIWPDE